MEKHRNQWFYVWRIIRAINDELGYEKDEGLYATRDENCERYGIYIPISWWAARPLIDGSIDDMITAVNLTADKLGIDYKRRKKDGDIYG